MCRFKFMQIEGHTKAVGSFFQGVYNKHETKWTKPVSHLNPAPAVSFQSAVL